MEKTPNICYKMVIKSKLGHYSSYNITTAEVDCVKENFTFLIYRIGEVTVPIFDNSELFAYDTLQNAEYYLKHHNQSSSAIILKCYCGHINVYKHMFVPTARDESVLMNLWNNKYTPLNGYRTPRGTITTPWVRPIEEIKDVFV